MKYLDYLLPLLTMIALGNVRAQTASTPTKTPAASALRSPWDSTPVEESQSAYDCGTVIPVSPDISTDAKPVANTTATPEGAPSADAGNSHALRAFTHRVILAADTFRADGSIGAAQCVATLLTAAAQEHAMNGKMSSDSAWKEQNRALGGLSIAFLKVRGSHALQPEQTALIVTWLNSVLDQQRGHYADAHCGQNGCAWFGHQGLETAIAAAAIAIATNDRDLYNFALEQYKLAVNHIDDNGMLHYDMTHQYALKFNLYSAAALVQIAEFAQANGDKLYDFNNSRLQLLVAAVANGLVDPSPFKAATGVDQAMPAKLETWEISWASIYDQRFPDPVLDQLLQQVNFKGSDMWGGEPWVLPATP